MDPRPADDIAGLKYSCFPFDRRWWGAACCPSASPITFQACFFANVLSEKRSSVCFGFSFLLWDVRFLGKSCYYSFSALPMPAITWSAFRWPLLPPIPGMTRLQRALPLRVMLRSWSLLSLCLALTILPTGISSLFFEPLISSFPAGFLPIANYMYK